MEHVAAVDQGTTGTRCLVVDAALRPAGEAYEPHDQQYPEPGWVEHDPGELWANTRTVLERALADAGLAPGALAALGVANQRETALLWDAATGDPLGNAVVWQDRRTADRVDDLRERGLAADVRARTGLEPDAYFSATKLEWLLDHHAARDRARNGDVLAGTVDAWLAYNLTGEHVTDVTNAARTMLFDVRDCAWDDDLLAEFGVPRACLPRVAASSHRTAYGATDPDGFLGAAIPVTGVLGDQQAALVGQACFEPGRVKHTCGTGSFLLQHTGTDPVDSEHGLLTTVAYQFEGEAPRYALEGSVFTTGAAVEWLTDLGVAADAGAVEALARDVDDTGGVYLVPAFQGLGAPHWDQRARGTVVGLTRGTGPGHLARATLEAIAFHAADVLDAMRADSGLPVDRVALDGGAAANDLLAAFCADATRTRTERPAVTETTALGAAVAAGLAVDVWPDREHVAAARRLDAAVDPPEPDLAARRDRWRAALDRARDWTPRNA